MAILLTIFKISLAIYLGGLAWFLLGLLRRNTARTDNQPGVSVVIAARGSSPWLLRLLQQLGAQSYPADKIEIVIVDDGLDSAVRSQVEALGQADKRYLMLTSDPGDDRLKRKNRALDAGINASQGDLLLFTDADCQIGSGWVSAMVACFTEDIDYVVGWSQIDRHDSTAAATGPGLQTLARFEEVDFLLLMLAGRSAVRLGTPWACSGQNQAYRRSVYQAAGGLSGLAGRIQGDDSLFLQLARHAAGAKVAFADDEAAFVRTEPSDDLPQFLYQRVRWAGDALAMLRFNPWFFPLPLATFLASALMFVLVALSFSYPQQVLPVLLTGLSLKALFEGALLGFGAPQVGLGRLLRHFPAWFLLQIPYVTLMGLGSVWGSRLGWRDRPGAAPDRVRRQIASDG